MQCPLGTTDSTERSLTYEEFILCPHEVETCTKADSCKAIHPNNKLPLRLANNKDMIWA